MSPPSIDDLCFPYKEVFEQNTKEKTLSVLHIIYNQLES
jgi:hypothetical protein